MIDNSVANPGQMGWGEPTQTAVDIIKKEKRTFESLARANPMLLNMRVAKEPNKEYIARLQQTMAAEGMTNGFSGRILEKTVFGRQLPWLAQIIGSCVASGAGRAKVRRMLAEVFLINDPETLFGTSIVGPNNVSPFLPYSYRAGRHFAGINGNSDGSFCSAHIRGASEYGILPCSTAGLSSDAFPEPQSSSTYRQWGSNNTLLNQFAAAGRIYKLLEAPKVTDAEQAKMLMDAFKPFMICSMWAFRPDHTHATWKYSDGTPVVIYQRDRSTSWAHNMTIDGIFEAAGRMWVEVDNSWGPRAHKNGSHFVIPIELFASWLRDAECMAIGEIDMGDNPAPVA